MVAYVIAERIARGLAPAYVSVMPGPPLLLILGQDRDSASQDPLHNFSSACGRARSGVHSRALGKPE